MYASLVKRSYIVRWFLAQFMFFAICCCRMVSWSEFHEFRCSLPGILFLTYVIMVAVLSREMMAVFDA